MTSCGICFKPLTAKHNVTLCKHEYHDACVRTWFKSNEFCPPCKELPNAHLNWNRECDQDFWIESDDETDKDNDKQNQNN